MWLGNECKSIDVDDFSIHNAILLPRLIAVKNLLRTLFLPLHQHMVSILLVRFHVKFPPCIRIFSFQINQVWIILILHHLPVTVSIEENILHVIQHQVIQSSNICVDQSITTMLLIRLIVNDMLIVQMVRNVTSDLLFFFYFRARDVWTSSQ